MSARRLKSAVRSVLNRITGHVPVSSGITILKEPAASALSSGWQDHDIAKRQHDAFRAVVADMHAGHVREDFAALVAAMKKIALESSSAIPAISVVEIGAGSGWNSEVLQHLLQRPLQYTGLDYSEAMMRLGQSTYPDIPFVVGDATQLPLADDCCDVLLSGTVLMHVLDYEDAIRESRRVTRRWCIFHTIPVLQNRETTVLQKRAYGVPVVEIVFNEARLLQTFEARGLRCIQAIDSIPHGYLDDIVGESVTAKTYLCETM